MTSPAPFERGFLNPKQARVYSRIHTRKDYVETVDIFRLFVCFKMWVFVFIVQIIHLD